ncbi:hypothetical protein [Algoriphagus algorifonticola]|uniref:hypothetical protein n=1 Tax=Algoriphagus algorifonticola TaxID=2593007 RepID=UPI0011A2ECB4|nr:hypothetical protein [Algoriphagus algorifonticola]
MRKIVYLLFFVFSITACVQDSLSPGLKQLQPEIVEAREWLQQSQEALDLEALDTKSDRLDPKFLTREFNWDRALVLIDSKNRTAIEVPVHYPNGMMFGVTGSRNPPKSIRTSLVLVKKQEKYYTTIFLKLYSDDPEHIFSASNFHQIGYLNIPDDFSGEFNFYSWDENWVGATVYKNGQPVRSRFPKDQAIE